jgi:hypothetical protein
LISFYLLFYIVILKCLHCSEPLIQLVGLRSDEGTRPDRGIVVIQPTYVRECSEAECLFGAIDASTGYITPQIVNIVCGQLGYVTGDTLAVSSNDNQDFSREFSNW